MKSKERVLLGMSGGTDSSVAAMKLQEAGYEVTGVTFRFYEVGGKTEYLEEWSADCPDVTHIKEICRKAIGNNEKKEHQCVA